MSKRCESCGRGLPQPVNYKLEPSLIGALKKLDRMERPARRAELLLTNVEYANFRKLTYWGLIENASNPDGSESLSLWQVTEIGRRFLTEGERIPLRVEAIGGEWVRNAGPFVDLETALHQSSHLRKAVA